MSLLNLKRFALFVRDFSCCCYSVRYGEFCQCNGTLDQESPEESYKCRANSNDTVPCSGRGNCVCGTCENCKQGYSGKFCEFDDSTCNANNGLPCAGHGICKFGKCVCDRNWVGDQCSCPDMESCIAPQTHEVCSGKGVCDCGMCICKRNSSTGVLCSGQYCDDCDEINLKRCQELKEYAYCNYVKNKQDCDKQYEEHKDSEVLFLNRTEINSDSNKKWCKKSFENGTALIFKFGYESKTLLLKIQKELELPPEINIWTPIGSAIGAVLLVGLLTLLAWKLLIDWYDRREYMSFKRSADVGCAVTSNVLYREPHVNFTNPTFQST